MDDFAFLTKVWMVRRSEGAESQPSLSAALSPRSGELEPEAGQSLSLKEEQDQGQQGTQCYLTQFLYKPSLKTRD